MHHIPRTSVSDPDMDRIRIQMGQKMEVGRRWKPKAYIALKKKKSLFSSYYFLRVLKRWGLVIF
jgi:hypothetical protein